MRRVVVTAASTSTMIPPIVKLAATLALKDRYALSDSVKVPAAAALLFAEMASVMILPMTTPIAVHAAILAEQVRSAMEPDTVQ